MKTIPRSPLHWVTSLYFAMGLPFVVLNMVSAVLFKDLGVTDARIAFWTSLIMWPWTIKFLWSPFLEFYRRSSPLRSRCSRRLLSAVPRTTSRPTGSIWLNSRRRIRRSISVGRGRSTTLPNLSPRAASCGWRGGSTRASRRRVRRRSALTCVRGRRCLSSCAVRSSLWGPTTCVRSPRAAAPPNAARFGRAFRA